MDKQINVAVSFIKKNPVTVSAIAFAILAAIGVILYSQGQSSALQRKHLDSESKLAQTIEDSKKKNSERLTKIAADDALKKKAAEETQAIALKAEEDKKAAEAAAAAAAKKKITYSEPSTSPSGGSINAIAGSPISKEGYTKVPISWTANFTSEKGYKLVWSTTPNPTYPGSDYQYIDKASASGTGYVKGTSGTVLYVRVCEYLGGSCGAYSNQLVVNL